MLGCLRTHVRKQPIIALYFESETVLKFYNLEARPRGYETFFMLNSTEHELSTAHKNEYYYIITDKCVGCNAPFTVRHFLLECGDFAQVRNNCFHVDNMKKLFQDIHIDSIMTFLRQINLFNKI